MTHKIDNSTCISCGNCQAVCPTGAAEFVDGEYKIDPAKCNDCATCAEQCPVACIHAVEKENLEGGQG